MSKLRVLHLIVQPVVVHDDGEELTPGPPINPVTLPPSRLEAFVAALPAEIDILAERLEREAAGVGVGLDADIPEGDSVEGTACYECDYVFGDPESLAEHLASVNHDDEVQ